MNELQVFQSPEFGELRTVEIDGEPWFVGKDVAAALGYANPSKAVIDHVDDEDKQCEMVPVADSPNGNLVKTAFINESGVYSLIFSSKLEGAKKFKRWVTAEVLPAIRKTGGYLDPAADPLAALTQAVQRLTEQIDAMGQQPALPALASAPPPSNKARRQWMRTASQKLDQLADECGLPSKAVLQNLYHELEMVHGVSLSEVRLKAIETYQLEDCSFLLAIFYDKTLRNWFETRVESYLKEINPFW